MLLPTKTYGNEMWDLEATSQAVPSAAQARIHVLSVSNHREAKIKYSFAGVFVDRQLISLKNAGAEISTFDVGSDHSVKHIIRKWIELRRDVRQLKPHIVHGQYGTIVGLLTSISGGTAVISFCGSDLLPGASVSTLRTSLGILLSNLAALRANAIICKTEELRRALWWRRSKAVVIAGGIDLDLFSPGPPDRARESLGWSLTAPVVLFNAARDPKNKGLDIAEAAMKVVQAQIPEVRLQVVTNVRPNLMPLYYRAADVLLFASKQEGSPNVVKEALACNLPIVSSPVGDVAELLRGVRPSTVVPRDPQTLGNAVVELLRDRRRSNGRQRVAHLGLPEVTQRILSVYRSVRSQGARYGGR